jgi:hypothetical protein
MAAKDDSNDRIGAWSHAIKRQNLKPGDHIYVRKFNIKYVFPYWYTHHGIFVGDKEMEVIHFSGAFLDQGKSAESARIQSCSLDEFSEGAQVRLAAYGTSYLLDFIRKLSVVENTNPVECRPAEEVIKVAKYYCQHPDLWDTYHLEKNNCETFAVYCKTGVKCSQQSGQRVRTDYVVKSPQEFM